MLLSVAGGVLVSMLAGFRVAAFDPVDEVQRLPFGDAAFNVAYYHDSLKIDGRQGRPRARSRSRAPPLGASSFTTRPTARR
jgi:hypothetical protein